MPFAFTARSDAQGQVRRIALEQIDKALSEAEEMPQGFDETVHRIRRRCKRLRGLLRLIRPAFDDFARENATVRDAASALSDTRDAKVVGETFEALVKDADLQIGADALEAMRSVLRPADASPDADGGRGMLADFHRQLGPMRQRVEAWDLDGGGFGLVDDGLEANYRRFRDDMTTARRTGSAEALHEWRKAAKYHWHHVSLFEKAAFDILSPQRDALDTLAERLGDHHNLAVLHDRFAAAADAIPKEAAEAVHEAVKERQHDLARDAYALGSQLTAERPGALRDRFAAYWRLLPED